MSKIEFTEEFIKEQRELCEKVNEDAVVRDIVLQQYVRHGMPRGSYVENIKARWDTAREFIKISRQYGYPVDIDTTNYPAALTAIEKLQAEVRQLESELDEAVAEGEHLNQEVHGKMLLCEHLSEENERLKKDLEVGGESIHEVCDNADKIHEENAQLRENNLKIAASLAADKQIIERLEKENERLTKHKEENDEWQRINAECFHDEANKAAKYYDLAKRLLDGLQAANPQPADLSLITEAREVLGGADE